MNAPKNPLLVGIIAGLVTAILMAAAGYASLLAIALTIAAMASIFVAGLGFGIVTCLVAIATAAASTATLYSNPLSFVTMALMSYLANMARPASEIGGPDATLAWYPLSDILLAGAIATAIGTVAILSLHGDMGAIYATLAEMIVGMMGQIDPPLPVDANTKTQLIGYFELLFPLMQGLQMMVALFAGFYFALRILSAYGHSLRPREDIRVSLRMNRLSIAVFLAGIVLMFAGDRIELIGAGFAGAMAGGFLLSGFALLHNALRDKTWRLPGLVLAYLLTLMLPVIPLLLIIAGGLANPRRAIALTPTKPDQTPANQN
jgi:hypothetical protein